MESATSRCRLSGLAIVYLLSAICYCPAHAPFVIRHSSFFESAIGYWLFVGWVRTRTHVTNVTNVTLGVTLISCYRGFAREML